jgi:cytoskeletal protein CcmA (bactofilin family)
MLFNRTSATRNEPERGARGAPERARGPEPPARDRKISGDAHAGGGADSSCSQSFIDASLTIMGDLHTDGDVRLDGRICGNVTCAQLIVGRDAAITGSVTAQQAIIRGTVTGTIRAPAVVLQNTARVESEITYTMLAIDDGATFEGAARHTHNPLEEAGTASSLADLQSIVHATGPAPNGSTGEEHEPAVVPPSAAPPGPSGI